jgi:integrase
VGNAVAHEHLPSAGVEFAVVEAAQQTHVRAGELFGLQTRHIDFLRRSLTVDQQLHEFGGRLVVGDAKTGSSHRTIPLSDLVIDETAAHLRRYPPGVDGWIFTAPLGGPIRRTNFMRRFWGPAARTVGIPPGTALHALRHYYASVLISGGLSVKVVSGRLGHTNAAQTLNVYAHLWPADEDRTRVVVDRALGRKTPPETDARRTAT